MKITFEIPDNTKGFHGCVICGNVSDLKLRVLSFGLDLDGLKDGKTYNIEPPKHGDEK